jgi:hypothetical protein
MTEPKTYPYIKYIPHLLILRIIVLGPFVVTQATAEFISNFLDKSARKIATFLPEAYIEKRVEWDQLPKRNQEAIEQLAKARDTTKERILIQTVKQ